MPANVNIQWLRSFIAVAELGTASRAAADAELSQPAVSRHIGKLEETVGLTLFDRCGRMRLSAAGAVLLPRARNIVRLHDLLLDEPLGEPEGRPAARETRP